MTSPVTVTSLTSFFFLSWADAAARTNNRTNETARTILFMVVDSSYNRRISRAPGARLFHQPGLENYVHPGKSLRDRAILLGAVGQLLELLFVDAGHLTLCRELDCGYLESLADFFKLCSCGGLDPRRRETRLGKAVREGH